RRAGANFTAEIESVSSRKHDVENDETCARGLEYAPHLAPLAGHGYPIAMLAQELCRKLADLNVVVDDQDLRLGGSGRRRGAVVGFRRGHRIWKTGLSAQSIRAFPYHVISTVFQFVSVAAPYESAEATHLRSPANSTIEGRS